MHKISLIYFVITLVCIIINFIYSKFSHGVSSNYMTYMFLIPLILGTLIYFIISLIKKYPKSFEYNIYNYAIITLTLGCFIKGVFEIAGTSSPFQIVYWIFGICFIVISFIKYIIN